MRTPAPVSEEVQADPVNCDPWGEHDFGAIEIDGEKIIWKIDCYDPTMTQGSENPANEALTHRGLTFMLANEY